MKSTWEGAEILKAIRESHLPLIIVVTNIYTVFLQLV